MGTRPRLPTNVIWSLEDAQAGVLGMWYGLREASKRAVKQEDAAMLGLLNEVMGELARVERHVRNARAGVYGAGCGEQGDGQGERRGR